MAQILDSSQESVTSALKRALAALQQRLPRDPASGARSAVETELVERFTQAFESSDLEGVIGLLTQDVWFAMPPLPYEWQGRAHARQFLAAMWAGQREGRRMVATRANRQPAFALYFPDPHGQVLHAVGLLVLAVRGGGISAITRFDNSLLSHFGLPRTIPAGD